MNVNARMHNHLHFHKNQRHHFNPCTSFEQLGAKESVVQTHKSVKNRIYPLLSSLGGLSIAFPTLAQGLYLSHDRM